MRLPAIANQEIPKPRPENENGPLEVGNLLNDKVRHVLKKQYASDASHAPEAPKPEARVTMSI